MPVTSMERRLIVGFTRYVLDAELSAEEALEAARALRAGSLLSGLIALLESLSADEQLPQSYQEVNDPANIEVPAPRKQQSGKKAEAALNVDELFEISRRRKITRSALLEILRRVNRDVQIDEDNPSMTTREALRVFRSNADDEDWKLLSNIVRGNVTLDPYLRGMMER